jgi:hypothetical protein
MDNPKFMDIYRLMAKDKENKMCFDCKRPFPKCVSVNNGIFVCDRCAEVHKALGLKISYIREVHDIWDEYLYMHIQRGGNKRLKLFFDKYDIDVKSDISYKYKTCAAEFYRQIVSISIN